MKAFTYHIISTLTLVAFILCSCADDSQLLEQDNARSLKISLTMPFDEPVTRVGLTAIPDSKDFSAYWHDDDKVQVIIRRGNESYDLGYVEVTDVSEDKKTASITIDRGHFSQDNFSIYCFVGNDRDGFADPIGDGAWSAHCTCDLKREPITNFRAPMFSEMKSVEAHWKIQGTFKHFGVYEILHIKNNTSEAITFAHQGFETQKPWYCVTSPVWFYDGYEPQPTGEWDGDVTSTSMVIAPQHEFQIVSWYIPSGYQIKDARLTASINGRGGIKSSNTFSSDVSLQRGHAYHMYATWDGEELKFGNGDETEEEKEEVPGEPIDLGLPSGTMWASCNLGATKPEEYGDFFSWGETKPKSEYTWPNYLYQDGNGHYVDIGSEIAGTEYDAATANWGSQWRMPTLEQIQELVNNCSTKWTARNGVRGLEVFGPNGNSIFLPAAGYNWNRFYEKYGYYRSSTLGGNNANCCYVMYFPNNADFLQVLNGDARGYGESIRPVYVGKPLKGDEETITVNGVSFKMIKVEGGTFTMGATPEQVDDAYDDEKPAHQVTLSSYYIGETEVTQALWEAVMGSNPSYNQGSNLPVEKVSWNDCQEFISNLNALTGMAFRLPTEAEWEFAARGGNKSIGYKYSGSNNAYDVAWFYGNSGGKSHVVRTKLHNELGVYDMSGNVWEWCQDCLSDYSSSPQTNPKGPSSGSFRVYRGGSWGSDAGRCRVSSRSYDAPGYRGDYLGFRLAM